MNVLFTHYLKHSKIVCAHSTLAHTKQHTEHTKYLYLWRSMEIYSHRHWHQMHKTILIILYMDPLWARNRIDFKFVCVCVCVPCFVFKRKPFAGWERVTPYTMWKIVKYHEMLLALVKILWWIPNTCIYRMKRCDA